MVTVVKKVSLGLGLVFRAWLAALLKSLNVICSRVVIERLIVKTLIKPIFNWSKIINAQV